MPLLERDHILDSLGEYARSAAARAGRLVLISGEAGVGKSSLAERLHEVCPDGRWAWGACDGLFTPRPLGPLFEIAEQLGGPLLDACRRGAGRDELFALVLKALDETAPPTVLVIEDVHWADESTLDLLGFLGRRVRDLPALVLVTYRDDALPPDHPLRLVLGALAAQRSTRRVTVSPLSEAAVGVLACGSGLEPGELYRLTGGNPFFVTEVVRAGSRDVPPSARDAVLARLARVSVAARRAVEAGALIGGQLDPTLLRRVTTAGAAELDELVDAGLLVSDRSALRFRHEITRVAVERDVPAHRRREVHVAVLGALLAGGCEDDARLAYHAEGAEDGPAVLRFAPHAAERAGRLAAHREAADQYARALRFAAEEPPALVATLSDSLAREAALVDQWARSAVASERALQLWRQVGDRRREGATLSDLSRTMWRLCRGAEHKHYSSEAVRTLEPLGPTPELARAHAMLAATHLHTDPRSGLAEVRKAQEIAADLDLPAVLSDALNTEACIVFVLGGDWEPPMRRALELAIAAGLPDQAGRAYANLQEILAGCRRYAESSAVFEEGIRYTEDNDIATYGYCLRGGQSHVLLESGRYDEARQICVPLLTSGVTSPANQIGLAVIAGLVDARLGRGDEGDHLDEAIRLATASGEGDRALLVFPAAAERLWLADDADGARVALAPAIEALPSADGWTAGTVLTWCRRLGLAVPEAPVPLPQVYARWLAGDFDEAVRLWDEIGCPYEAALAAYDSGTEPGLRAALRRFEALGTDAAAQACRREMRRLGIRSIPVGARAATRAHPLGLTRREQEVLDLICAGHTNAEISEQLYVSSRTVDHHVSAVLAKLGVPSRAVAAAEAARLGLVPSG